MAGIVGSARRLLRREEGAATIEFAVVSVAFVLFSLGTLELGRAFEVRNRLAFAADMAAREILRDSEISDADIETEIRAAFDAHDPDLLQIEIATEEVDGIDFRTVSVSYPFVPLIPQLAKKSLLLSTNERVPVT